MALRREGMREYRKHVYKRAAVRTFSYLCGDEHGHSHVTRQRVKRLHQAERAILISELRAQHACNRHDSNGGHRNAGKR